MQIFFLPRIHFLKEIAQINENLLLQKHWFSLYAKLSSLTVCIKCIHKFFSRKAIQTEGMFVLQIFEDDSVKCQQKKFGHFQIVSRFLHQIESVSCNCQLIKVGVNKSSYHSNGGKVYGKLYSSVIQIS